MRRVYFKALSIPAGGSAEEAIEFGQPGVIASLYLNLPDGVNLTFSLHGRSLPEEGEFVGPLELNINPLGLRVKQSPYKLTIQATNGGSSEAVAKVGLVFSLVAPS